MQSIFSITIIADYSLQSIPHPVKVAASISSWPNEPGYPAQVSVPASLKNVYKIMEKMHRSGMVPINTNLETKGMNCVRDFTNAVRELGGIWVDFICSRIAGLLGPTILSKERIVKFFMAMYSRWEWTYIDVYVLVAGILEAERDKLVSSCKNFSLRNILNKSRTGKNWWHSADMANHTATVRVPSIPA